MENSNFSTNQPISQDISNQNIPTINSDILQTLRQISLIFFFIIGGAHLLSGLLVSQNLLLPVSNLINKVLDIPFAVIAVVYGLSNIHLQSDNPRRKLYLTLMSMVSLAVLGLLLYITLLIPDRIS